MTPQEKEERARKDRQYQKDKVKNMTPEKRKEFYKIQRLIKKMNLAELTLEEQENRKIRRTMKRSEQRRKQLAKMTPEEKKAFYRRRKK